MSEHYDFHYQPTGSGAISGQQVLEQTEDAINELGDYVNDNVGGAMDVAQQALETAQNAEQDAQTALDTANSFSDAIQSAQQDASTALSTAQTAQTTATNANNTAIQAQQDANTAVTTANNASGQVSTLSGTVTTLGQRVTTAEGDIGQNTSDITTLGQRVTTAEGNITTLQNDVTIAQGNASSAMATAGQVKQQAYVFRYSSTALVASSTNSNALLDNTDNLKVGDKVIDSSGVLFSITAIDTENSTFTIGTALIDLAQDSDVVHKSGNETVSGQKTWSGNQFFTSNVYHKGTTYEVGNIPTSNIVTNIYFADKNSVYTGFARNVIYSSGRTATELRAKNLVQNGALAPTGSEITSSFNVEVQSNGDRTLYFDGSIRNDVTPYTTNNNSLGSSTNQWKTLNGINPGALSLPSGNLNDVIDISSYFSNTGSVTNSYTAPANGWIYLRLGDISSCQATVYDANNNRMWGQSSQGGVEQITIPILKGQTLTTQWATTSSVTVATARFIPCQGNV